MARESKTKYALLGLLAWGPMSGYDMKKAIDRSLGFFWNESYGQIYPIMKQLTDMGLVTREVVHQAGKPDRHLYAITDQGRVEFQQWLVKPTDPHHERVETVLKIFYGPAQPPQESLAHISRFRAEHTALLAQYAQISAHLNGEHAGTFGLDYWLLTIRCGELVSQAYLQWCEEAEATLRRIDAGEGEMS